MVSTEKHVQLESCELSFIWGKIKTVAQEAASHRALRDCSKAVVGERGLVKEEFNTILQKTFC